MLRSHLEHVIRAAGAISGDTQIVVIGSQAILGQFPNAPAALRASMDADLYPRHHPELATFVDGAIGEQSRFHEQFGYYAQGVGPETAVLPAGWTDRLVRIANENTGGVEGLCLEVHDLAISKYAAGRPKDLEFTRTLAKVAMIDRKVLLARLRATRVDRMLRALIQARIDRDLPAIRRAR